MHYLLKGICICLLVVLVYRDSNERRLDGSSFVLMSFKSINNLFYPILYNKHIVNQFNEEIEEDYQYTSMPVFLWFLAGVSCFIYLFSFYKLTSIHSLLKFIPGISYIYRTCICILFVDLINKYLIADTFFILHKSILQNTDKKETLMCNLYAWFSTPVILYHIFKDLLPNNKPIETKIQIFLGVRIITWIFIFYILKQFLGL